MRWLREDDRMAHMSNDKDDSGTQDGKPDGKQGCERPDKQGHAHDADASDTQGMDPALLRFHSDAATRKAVGKALRDAARDGSMLGVDGFDILVRQLVTQTAGIPFRRSNGWPSLEQIERNDYAWLTCLADLIDPVAVPWIPNEMEGYVYCGECGEEIGEYYRPSYCEYCGTRVMSTEEEHEADLRIARALGCE